MLLELSAKPSDTTPVQIPSTKSVPLMDYSQGGSSKDNESLNEIQKNEPAVAR